MKRGDLAVKGIFWGWALISLAGCSVTLRSGQLISPAGEYHNPIVVAEKAEKMHNTVGLVHFTLLFIPVGPVTVEGEADQELMRVMGEAVKRMGYEVRSPAQAADCPDCPRLSVTVNRFAFHDYTWFFPMVFTWGTINLDVKVADPGGRTLWTKTYEAKASNSEMEFDPAVNEALNKILNEMIRDMATREFQQKVWGTPPAPAAL